jgi:hypothetical protein
LKDSDYALYSTTLAEHFYRQELQDFVLPFFAALPKTSIAKSAFGNGKGIIVREDEGEHILTTQSTDNRKTFQSKAWPR